MAISLVTVGTEGSAGSGNVVPGMPAGVVANDVLICAFHSSDQVSSTMSGLWTLVTQGNGGGTTSRISIWWRRATSSAVLSSGARTITHAAGASPIAGIAAFRGCLVSASPIHAKGTKSLATGGTSRTHTGLTTTVSGCMQLLVNGEADDNNRTLLTGFTNVFEDSGVGTNNAYVTTAGTPDGSVSMFYKLLGAAATVSTAVVTSAASDPWIAIMLALRPATVTEPGNVGPTWMRYYSGMRG